MCPQTPNLDNLAMLETTEEATGLGVAGARRGSEMSCRTSLLAAPPPFFVRTFRTEGVPGQGQNRN